MGTSRNHPSPRLAWFLIFFVIFVACIQVFLGLAYNTNSTPFASILFSGFITLITFVFSFIQIFPGGLPSFLRSLQISGFKTFLRRRALFIALSLLFISLLLNIYLLFLKTRLEIVNKPPSLPRSTSTVTPSAVSSLAGSLHEFSISTPNSRPVAIVKGSDGNLWFTEEQGNKVGRITPQGSISEFPIPTPLVVGQQNYHEMSVGPDRNIWFTEGLADKIGRITPQGEITEFTISTSKSRPVALTMGQDKMPSRLLCRDEGKGSAQGRKLRGPLQRCALHRPLTSNPNRDKSISSLMGLCQQANASAGQKQKQALLHQR